MSHLTDKQPWRRRRDLPSKRLEAITRPDGALVQKTAWKKWNLSALCHFPLHQSYFPLHCTVSLSLACYTGDKQVSCYYGRCTCRLTADLALQQMSYTKCIEHKAILSGGVWERNADCPSFSIQKEVIPSVSVVLSTRLLQTIPKEGNRTHFQNILSSQVIIVFSGCVPFVCVWNMVARIEGGM